jgi:hypothetical protein
MPVKVVSFPRAVKRACAAERLLPENNIAVSRTACDLETVVHSVAIEQGRL